MGQSKSTSWVKTASALTGMLELVLLQITQRSDHPITNGNLIGLVFTAYAFSLG